MLRRVVAAIAFCWVLGGAVEAGEITDSVVLLYRQDFSGSLKFTCTATSFRERPEAPRLFLSAAHCVTEPVPGKPGEVAQTKDPIYLSFDEEDEKKYTKATVKTLGSQNDGFDFVVLESKLDAPALLLGDEKTLKPGARVAAVTASLGFGKGYAEGYVAIPKVDRPLVSEQNSIDWRGALLLNLNVAGGASGSAIVSLADGKIVGVLVGSVRGLTIAIPVSKLKEIMVPSKSKAVK